MKTLIIKLFLFVLTRVFTHNNFKLKYYPRDENQNTDTRWHFMATFIYNADKLSPNNILEKEAKGLKFSP